MDRLALIQEQQIVETTVTFSISRKRMKSMDRCGYNRRGKKSFNQRLQIFHLKKRLKTMDRLAIIQEQKIVEIMVRF